MVGSSVFSSTKLEIVIKVYRPFGPRLSCKITLQIGILFDVEVCSSLAIYIVLHITSRVVFDRERFSMLLVVLFRLPTYLH